MRWRHGLLLVAMVLLAGTGMAIEGYNGSNDSDMHIMGGSSASASKGVSPNGTMYTAEVAMNGTTTSTSNSIGTPSYSSQDGQVAVSFEGRIRSPTPCHTIDHSIEKEKDGSYTMTVETVDEGSDEMCTQQLVGIEYDASFSAKERFDLTVKHDNTVIDTFSHPGPTRRETGQQAGFLLSLITWFTGLF